MRISVVIPTYNRLEYLKQAFESLEVQDYPVWEIIVIDDGSTDGTKDYVLSNWKNVKFLTQRNMGPGAARNKGIDIATGDYIAFLDSDDLWFPWTAGVYRKSLEESDAGIVFGNPIRFHDRSELDEICFKEVEVKWLGFHDYLQSGSEWRWWGVSSIVVSRKLLNGIRFTDLQINGEDADFLMKLGNYSKLAQVVSPPTFAYREHSGSVMKDFSKTLSGIYHLIDSENKGIYPGGVERAYERTRIISRHTRPVSFDCLEAGLAKDGWKIYKVTFLWNLRLGRFKYLFGFPIKALLK